MICDSAYYGLYSNSWSVFTMQFDAVYHVYHHLIGVVVREGTRLVVVVVEERLQEPIGMAMNRWCRADVLSYFMV